LLKNHHVYIRWLKLLPFLKSKKSQIAGIIIKNRAPDESKASEENEPEDKSISEHTKSLMSAIKSDDHEHAEDCLRAIFKALDKEPHEEGEHTKASPHSYDAQNEEAAD
jgi:hypothetical protein